MKSYDLEADMLSNLHADKTLNSPSFKIKLAMECLDKAAISFDRADLEVYSEEVIKIMEKLSLKV
jgi:hypothetical protein